MVERMKQALAALAQLSEAQQERMAQWILETLEDEARWDAAFQQSQPQLEALALKALRDAQEGRTHPLNPDELG